MGGGGAFWLGGREGGREGSGAFGRGQGGGVFRVELRCSFCVCMFCLSKGEAGWGGGGEGVRFRFLGGLLLFSLQGSVKMQFLCMFHLSKGGVGGGISFLGGRGWG